jgi:hypothetical protein
MPKDVRITKSQHEKDSYVIAAILTGEKESGKKLKESLPGMETPQGLCAVGAGLRGKKATRGVDVITRAYQAIHGEDDGDKILHQIVPMIRFATVLGVSENYACGVNDGFEDSFASKSFYPAVNKESPDYIRGYSVGHVIREHAGYAVA